MKLLVVLFPFIAFSCFAQSPERQVYLHYFKPLYAYEPALIRENAIQSLSIRISELRNNTVDFEGIKERIDFREDGRPTMHVVKDWSYGDSIYKVYTYDSIGKLIEYNSWSALTRKSEVNRNLGHNFFIYDGNRLKKAFYFNARYNGDDEAILIQCDSLIYNDKKQTITILTGFASDQKIALNGPPTTFYPNLKIKEQTLPFNEFATTEKPVDKELLWTNPIVYSQKELTNLQRITKYDDLSALIKTTGCNGVFIDSAQARAEKSLFPEHRFGLFSESCILDIDTIRRKIYCKTSTGGIEPTSLENRVHSTVSLHTFDYSLRLLRTESIHESSRGVQEFFRDSSITIYAYYKFGLLERKQEFHYQASAINNAIIFDNELPTKRHITYNPAWIHEEKTVLKLRTP